MSGLSVSLPLSKDSDDGLKLNKDFKDLVRQNLLMLLLTIKGERIMHPDFGVGLKRYLFELDTPALRSELSSKIRSQVSKYLSYINIINLSFESQIEKPQMDKNLLIVRIEYIILPLNISDNISITREDNTLITF